MPTRTANAAWEGTLREGSGTMHFDAYDGPYSFRSRFEDGAGTNPEELIAAAHAGCFSMALAGGLGAQGHAPERVTTRADVHIEPGEGGFTITRIDLHTEASVPGLDDAAFQEAAATAKAGCPVSKALAATDITLEARLV